MPLLSKLLYYSKCWFYDVEVESNGYIYNFLSYQLDKLFMLNSSHILFLSNIFEFFYRITLYDFCLVLFLCHINLDKK